MEIAAEAESNYLAKLTERIGVEQAAAVLIAQKYLAGFDTISRNPSDKVFLPNSFPGLFSLPVDKSPRTE